MSRDAISSPLARLWQFSLRDLALLAVVVAAGSYSLANASDLWLRWWITVLGVAVVTSGLLAIYRQEAIRAFFTGFTIFGGLYLALLLSALSAPNFTITGTLIARFLPHTVLDFVYFNLLPLVKDGPVPAPPFNGGGGMGGPGMGGGGAGGMGGGGFFSVPDLLGQFGGMSANNLPAGTTPAPAPPPPITGRSYYPDLDTFQAVGHSLFGLIIAYLGGLATQAIYLLRPKIEVSSA